MGMYLQYHKIQHPGQHQHIQKARFHILRSSDFLPDAIVSLLTITSKLLLRKVILQFLPQHRVLLCTIIAIRNLMVSENALHET